MINQLTQLVMKVETATEGFAGTGATGIGGSNAILCEDLDFQTEVSKHERNAMQETLSKLPAVMGSRLGKVTGKVALIGLTGTTGAPEYEPILLCCGHEVTGSTYKEYTPHSGDPNALGTSYTVKFHRNGKILYLIGCRGDGKFVFEVSKPWYYEFEIWGPIYSFADGALQGSTSYLRRQPLAFQNCATDFTIGGYKALISKWEIATGNKLGVRTDPNAASGIRSVIIGDRNVMGSLDPEQITGVTAADWYDLMIDETEREVVAQLGATDRNKVKMTVPKTQFTSHGSGDRDGVAVAETENKINMDSAAGDEYVFRVY